MTIYYAIGDIHGEETRLALLHEQIAEDAGARPHVIVHLGDLIDRGFESRGVIERIMQLEKARGKDAVVTIRGNHEELMLHAYDNNESVGIYWWATNGGDETIASYKRANGDADDWRDAVDAHHIKWLRSLPVMWRVADRGLVFVHGGIDPKTFPNEDDEVRLWTRSEKFFQSERWPDRDELRDILVVHGHTPTNDLEPEVQRRRINIDTGVCFGGRLTAVALAPGEAPRFLHA
jgi:diadenosine tetraphosphatase ApaH/serine/threonine PP2A family protein phosphatase